MTDITKYERVQNETEISIPNNRINEDIDIDGDTKVEILKTSNLSSFGFLHKSVITLILILVYFILSIGLTFYQRSLLAEIKFPLTIVLYHLLVKLLLSYVIRIIYRCQTGKSRILLDFSTCFQKLAPAGLASGIDIGFSNWGLELVNISLYTMTKSTTIIFILIFAILLGLEKKSWSLMFIVVMISGGLFLVTYKSTSFDMLGFSFLLFASLSSGIRWSFAQLIMQKSKLGLHNPVDMVFHMQPWMMISILPFTLVFEGKSLINSIYNMSDVSNTDITWIWFKISGGAFIAFAMELSEFLLLCQTSSLTLSVTGIFKEICQVILAVLINNDQLSPIKICGFALCIGGIICHVYHKYTEYSAETNRNNSIESIVKFEKNRSDSTIGRIGQRIPLLDGEEFGNSDSDDSHNENQNSSEVIFDVLKRRDIRR